MTERKVTVKKAVAPKSTEKKTAPRRTSAKKVAFEINAESVGFRAGDVYQALATAENSLSVAEIAKAANISTEETLLGMGWLFKEGKVKEDTDNKITLA